MLPVILFCFAPGLARIERRTPSEELVMLDGILKSASYKRLLTKRSLNDISNIAHIVCITLAATGCLVNGVFFELISIFESNINTERSWCFFRESRK